MSGHRWRNLKPSEGVWRPGDLSKRQKQILGLVSDGYTNKESASVLGVSIKTVEYHKACVMHKANIFDVAGLTKLALRLGLTDIHHHHTTTEGVEIRE